MSAKTSIYECDMREGPYVRLSTSGTRKKSGSRRRLGRHSAGGARFCYEAAQFCSANEHDDLFATQEHEPPSGLIAWEATMMRKEVLMSFLVTHVLNCPPQVGARNT